MNLSYREAQKSCVNNSPSKQQFSFSKCSRFKYKTQASLSNSRFIMPESSIDNRYKKGPSFPKVIKKLIFPFQKQMSKIPSSDRYHIQSSTQFNRAHRIGIIINKQSIEIKRQKINNFPGPCTYKPKYSYSFKSNRSGSFSKQKKKFQYPKQLQKGRQSPGPAYLIDVKKLQTKITRFQNKNSMCVYSHSNSLSVRKNLSYPNLANKQNNFQVKKLNISLQKLKKQRKISDIDVTHKKSNRVLFTKAKRKSIFQNKEQDNKPGPGRYQKISEFARLQKKVYNQNKNTKKLNFFIDKNNEKNVVIPKISIKC